MRVIYKQPSNTRLPFFGVRDCYFKTLSTFKDSRIVTHKLHHHNFVEMHILKDGCECYEVEGQNITLVAGDMLIVRACTPHRLIDSDLQTRKYVVCFSADVQLPNSLILSQVSPRMWERIAMIEEEAEYKTESARFLLGNAVAELVIMTLRLSGITEESQKTIGEEYDVVSMAKQYIIDNIDNAPSVSDVAAYCAMSTKHLGRLFMADLEMSPGDYIIKLRVERAVELLSTTNWPLKEISERMHFSSVYYFCAFFKSNVGLPPGEYRGMCGR